MDDDEMAASLGASRVGSRGGGAAGFESKGLSPDEQRDTGTEIFQNGEFLPSELDTTQLAYNAVVSNFYLERTRRCMLSQVVFLCLDSRCMSGDVDEKHTPVCWSRWCSCVLACSACGSCRMVPSTLLSCSFVACAGRTFAKSVNR